MWLPTFATLIPVSQIKQPTTLFGNWGTTFTIRTEGSKEQLQTAIESMWNRYFPNAMTRISTMEADFADQNATDLRIAHLLTGASLITIAIAAFGIYVLAALWCAKAY